MATEAQFLATIFQEKEYMEEDFLTMNYFIIIEKGLRTAKTYQSLPANLDNAEWIIVVSPYNWGKMGYTNTSLKVVGMYNRYFIHTNVIPFSDWWLTGLDFKRHFGQYYNAWLPCPILEHRTKMKGLTIKYFNWTEKFGAFDINNMSPLLESIWTFEDEYSKWNELKKWYGNFE